MTSELRVDNLKGSTTGGSINVLAGGGSSQTNLQDGLAKAFYSVAHESGTPTTKAGRVSGNISFDDGCNNSTSSVGIGALADGNSRDDANAIGVLLAGDLA